MQNKLTYLIIHCLATREGVDVRPESVVRWHTTPPPAGRGWNRVGYSKLVLLDGTLHSFINENEDNIVDPWELTNGAIGINRISRHIAYVGGLAADGRTPKDTRTPAQELTLIRYCNEMLARYPDIIIAGHYHFANKACPSFDVTRWALDILKWNKENVMLRRRI